MSDWLEVGANNYVLVTEGSLLNTGLIIGSGRALVIDTGCGTRQGREIPDAVREKTQLPHAVVGNTHAHYDHFFGNAVFAAVGVTEFWAHRTAQPKSMSAGTCSAVLWALGAGDVCR